MPDKNDVLEMMARAEAVYLATSDGVSPRIRALVNLRRPDCHAERSDFCAQAGFTSYFSTSRASGKVRDVLSNPMVSVYYSDPAETHGIELRGPAEVVDDEAIRQRLWQDEWRIYWPDGCADPDYVILRLRPEFASGWWGTQPFELEMKQG
jgi:general stress protein 26